jgi:hypothetical protein
MDETEVLEHDGWRFLCIGQQLPSGGYQAVVRQWVKPYGQIHTLRTGSEVHDASWRALAQAKELAMEWAAQHPNPAHGRL